MTGADHEQLLAQVANAAQQLAGRRIATLTGAGLSTDSGIPAYRGAGARNVVNPMTYQRFLADEASRVRYWIGSHLGWRTFADAEPNAGHHALATLESEGAGCGVATQNVDGLHLRAGSSTVIELHGTMRRVACLRCGQVFDRRSIAEVIEADNPWIEVPDAVPMGPDGDVAPPEGVDFRIPRCSNCEGMLKPEIVFFGELVPHTLFAAAEAMLASSNALLVAGTSLAVNSGVRLVERARRRSLPIVFVNLEPTKLDPWATAIIRGNTSAALPALVDALR